MTCASCGKDYEMASGDNQRTKCPHCGKAHGTDAERADMKTHAEVIHWFEQWEERTAGMRALAERDTQYYHGNVLESHWTSGELAELKKRNQAPVIINRIKKKIDYLRGQEIRNRTDPKALPRTMAHDDDALAITDGLRAIGDAENVNSVFTRNWTDLLLAGWCGLTVEPEVLAAKSPEDGAGATQQGEVEIRVRHERWDRLWWDPYSLEPDYSDALYKGTHLYMDPADVRAYYAGRPDAAANLDEVIAETERSAGGDNPGERPRGWYDAKRKQVRIAIAYYRHVDPKTNAVSIYYCHFTKGGFVVSPRPTGIKDEHGKDICPLIMDSAFVDQNGDRYGLVRQMIGPQDEINHRRSKALREVSVHTFMMEEGAVANPDEFSTTVATPGKVAIVQPGALAGGRIEKLDNISMSQPQFNLLAEAKGEIDATGPDAPMVGSTQGDSGRALQLRQQIGSMEIEPVTDHHRRVKRTTFRHIFLGMRQFKLGAWWARVTDDAASQGYKFVGLNQQTNVSKAQRVAMLMQSGTPVTAALSAAGAPPDLVQAVGSGQMAVQQALAAEPMLTPYIANDVARLDADIVIDEAPDTAIIQHEELQELREISQSIISSGAASPQLVQGLVKANIEASGLRQKKKLIALLEPPPDPAQQQMAAMMQQMQQRMAQLEMALKEAQVLKTQSEAELNQARTASTTAEVQVKQADAMNKAADAGAKTAGGFGRPNGMMGP